MENRNVVLNELAQAMMEVAGKYPEFSPYKPDVRAAYLHDSPAIRLTCEIKMMIGSDPNTWTRSYFVQDLEENVISVCKYDLAHSFSRDVGLLSVMSSKARNASADD